MCKDEQIEIFHAIDVHAVCLVAAPLVWKPGSVNTRISKKALPGGTDTDGATIFVGRASVNDIMLPAKIIPDRQKAYVCEWKGFLLDLI